MIEFLKLTSPIHQKLNTRNNILGKVQCGLWETSKLMKEYLKAADLMLSSITPSIRDAIWGQ